jgi:hypothetical protein
MNLKAEEDRPEAKQVGKKGSINGTVCVLFVYRDLPLYTHPMDDWRAGEEGEGKPRSPRFIFGKTRPLSVKVEVPKDYGDTLDLRVVNVSSTAAPKPSLTMTCKKHGQNANKDYVYISKTAADGDDETLYLWESTDDRGGLSDRIHVVEEELLEFMVALKPACKVDWMVDRGEAAAVTVHDDPETVPAPPAPDYEYHTPAGFNPPARIFRDGTGNYPAPTTSWWSAGHAEDRRNPDFKNFILNCGSNDAKHRECDILHIGAHGYLHGRLSTYLQPPAPGAWVLMFAPRRDSHYRKIHPPPDGPGPRPVGSMEREPRYHYFDPTRDEQVAADLTFGTPVEWDTDIDWAMFYSCLTLSGQEFDVGQTVYTPNPTPPPDHIVSFNSTEVTRTYQQWYRAFDGTRRLHGMLGFYGLGSNGSVIRDVLDDWVRMTGTNRMSVPEAWLKATWSRGEYGAVLYMPHNGADTVHEMHQDPAAADKPIYRGSTAPEGMKKKIKKNGKFKNAGPVPPHVAMPSYSFEEQERPAYGTILGDAITLKYPLPSGTPGGLPRLHIVRNETLSPDSVLALNEMGEYEYAPPTPLGVPQESTVTQAQAEARFRTFLSDNFVHVPADLETHGVFSLAAALSDENDEIVAFESGYEITLEQRWGGLAVFNSNAFAMAGPDGEITYAYALFYGVTPVGTAGDLIGAQAAAEIAGGHLLEHFDPPPVFLTDILLYYGYDQDANGATEVRPVWGIEFGFGKVVYTIDAATGEILEVRS